MTQDAAAIAAKGLSEAQRADLLKVSDSGARMFLTPLGLAVRAHLQAMSAGAGDG